MRGSQFGWIRTPRHRVVFMAWRGSATVVTLGAAAPGIFRLQLKHMLGVGVSPFFPRLLPCRRRHV